ncbi:MAG: hypothetical protein AAGJ35_13085, partial [Myxococcota bacterium]
MVRNKSYFQLEEPTSPTPPSQESPASAQPSSQTASLRNSNRNSSEKQQRSSARGKGKPASSSRPKWLGGRGGSSDTMSGEDGSGRRKHKQRIHQQQQQ